MVFLRDGFTSEHLHVLPRPLVAESLRLPLTERLLVTDAGFFPKAQHHPRRPHGAEELIVILTTEGSGWVETPGTSDAITVGQVAVIPPGTPHSYGADPTDPWTTWWFHVVGTEVRAHVEALHDRLGDGIVFTADVATVEPLFRAVVSALGQDETRAALLASSGAAWHALSMLGAVAAPTRGRSTHAAITAVCEHLRENLAEPTNVPALARQAQLSTSHFGVAFRRTTGVGVVEYVRRLRMARARYYLEATNVQVSEIARMVGFDDPFYFSRQFRAVVGVAPSAFRDMTRRSARGELGSD